MALAEVTRFADMAVMLPAAAVIQGLRPGHSRPQLRCINDCVPAPELVSTLGHDDEDPTPQLIEQAEYSDHTPIVRALALLKPFMRAR